MNEILLGLAAGVTEGVVETIFPATTGLVDKGNKCMKDAAPAGYMAGELSRGLTKAVLLLFI